MRKQWRTRALVEVHANIDGEEFVVDGAKAISRPEFRDASWPDQIKILDIELTNHEIATAIEAHIVGINLLNRFLDRISLVTYAPAILHKIVSTTISVSSVGEEFEMVTADSLRHISSPKLSAADLNAFNGLPENTALHESIHHVRLALTDQAAEQHLLHLHIAAERIAISETTDRVKNVCPQCSHEWQGPPASRRAVRALLNNRGVSANDANDAIEYRGRVAHGGGRRDVNYYERVTELAGAVESAVISTVAEKSGVKIYRRHNVVVGMPIVLHTARKDPDGAFTLLNTSWQAPMRFPELGADISEPGGSAMAGFPTSRQIDPCAWPG